MPKKFIEKFMPDPHSIREHKHLRIFGSLLHNPNLWALNRKSAPGAFAVGLFCAWTPIPFQMIMAAALAIFFNVNLPLSVALVWLTNPFTMPFLFYAAYWLGTKLLNQPIGEFTFELSWQWLEHSLSTIGPPFLLGCLVLGFTSSIISYFIIKQLWRFSVVNRWKRRK
ncbi:DUF2062 domain-containing protein [Parashewanella spongiae]|uniref:DUF2062 domain-containing protein n=1 Tax=Parashewanella spongiae TaxID=342950 RepID=A0A3A6U2F9_9GAMM|nr:DUF2062 domain-containing protein [Parashewanella spongiae]MCL1077576.1 DUF2062 domain-containing protein [Parashewanella spongiae]RJY18200.1 DUF2062 domain-containing protein [Parashewanella spongiae]